MAEPSQILEPDLSGQTLDRYQLLRRLGIGGMGAVYEGEHTALGKRVAVKLLRHEFTRQEIARKRFLREARAATKVEHPNVVNISDFGETLEGRVYFVMELLDGRDLGELLKEVPRLPWARARRILLQVASALETAHAQGIIHRDMKPSNCFLVRLPGLEGTDLIKVLDFGIAKLAGGPGHETEALTSTDEVFGTVAYMAPEMAQGTTNDLRSDIYATGVMMYRMLTGRLPFSEGNAFQILSQHINASPAAPRSLEPSIPPGVEGIILKALQKDVRYRFQTMRAFAKALERGAVPPDDSATVRHERPDVPATDATEVLSGPLEAAKSGSGRTSGLASASSSGSTVLVGPTESSTGPSGTLVLSSESAAARVPAPVTTAPASMSTPASGSGSATSPTGATQLATLAANLGTGTVTLTPQSRALPVALLVVLVAGVLVGAVALGIYIAREQGGGPSVAATVPASPSLASPSVEAAPAEPPDPTSPGEFAAAPAEAVEAEGAGGGDEESGTEEPAVTPADPQAPEPESKPEPEAKPEPRSAPARSRKPKSDQEVIARLVRKMKARCSVDGSTTVRLEGLISASGKVQGAMATPRQGPGTCAETILRAARFAPRAGSSVMPMFKVEL